MILPLRGYDPTRFPVFVKGYGLSFTESNLVNGFAQQVLSSAVDVENRGNTFNWGPSKLSEFATLRNDSFADFWPL